MKQEPKQRKELADIYKGGITMALKFAIQTALEIVAVILIIYGFCREEKLIEFEDRIKARIRERANSSRKK